MQAMVADHRQCLETKPSEPKYRVELLMCNAWRVSYSPSDLLPTMVFVSTGTCGRVPETVGWFDAGFITHGSVAKHLCTRQLTGHIVRPIFHLDRLDIRQPCPASFLPPTFGSLPQSRHLRKHTYTHV